MAAMGCRLDIFHSIVSGFIKHYTHLLCSVLEVKKPQKQRLQPLRAFVINLALL